MKLRTPMPHQYSALDYVNKRGRIALFMEMRLGKTLVAIRWCKDMARDSKVLIVAPLAVLHSWEDELIKEGISKSDIRWVKGSKTQRSTQLNDHSTGFFLIGYESLRVTPSLQKDPSLRVIILDESTRIRNPKAQITKILLTKFSHVPYRAILSGFPAPESPLDYFCQIRFLYPRFLGCWNYWQFRKEYAIPEQYSWYVPVSSQKKIKEDINSKAFVLTRKDVNLGSKKVYEKRYVQMTPGQRKLYRQIEDEFAYTLESGTEETNYAITKVLWLARVAGGYAPSLELLSEAKHKEVLNLLESELAGQQVLIWFRFNQELEEMVQHLHLAGYKAVGITGDMETSKRYAHMKQFQNKEIQIICIQIKCGKFGLDLSTSSTSIYFSNSYSCEDREQSEDRIVHPSKTEPLLYLDIITEGTIDEDVVSILREKATNAKYFMLKLIDRIKERRTV